MGQEAARSPHPVLQQLHEAEPEAGWRHARSHLYLASFGPHPEAPPFRFSGLQARHITVALHSLSGQRLDVTGHCDAPVQLHRSGAAPQGRARQELAFSLSPREAGRSWLELDLATTRCDLRISPADGAAYDLRLEREEIALHDLQRHEFWPQGCTSPVGADGYAALFTASRHLSQSCAMPVGQPEFHADPREAFQAKVVALTGQRLPDAVLDTGDVNAPIDFSQAPALDMIYLSYLHIRADFTGYMIARMLAYHAMQGTTVRILLTRNAQTRRDRVLLESLAARFPGIQLQQFRWRPEGLAGPGALVSSIHRANHIKLFATLSPQPGRSSLMLGGRNLHDGFVFDTPRDLSSAPQLHNYDPEVQFSLGFFSAYDDFEISYSSEQQVREIAAHLARFWHRDHGTHVVRPFVRAHQEQGQHRAAQGGMRHFISVPHADGRALERLYIALFDAAQHRVVMSSPFLNLTPGIEAAVLRALDRGVSMTLVTRIDVPEPTSEVIASQNRIFVERFAGRMEIYEYPRAPRTLHSKLLVIDGQVALVSSVNLNRRSFLHDTENGVLVLDHGFAARLTGVLEGYVSQSLRLTPEVAVSPLMRGLLYLPFIRDIL